MPIPLHKLSRNYFAFKEASIFGNLKNCLLNLIDMCSVQYMGIDGAKHQFETVLWSKLNPSLKGIGQYVLI